MFGISYLLWTVWVGLGLCVARDWLRCRFGQAWATLPFYVAVVHVVLLVVVNGPLLDLSEDQSARRLGEELLLEMKPNSLFLGTWADVPILEYLQLVEHRRPDIEVRNLVFLGAANGRSLAREKVRLGGRVYTTATGLMAGDGLLFLAGGSNGLAQLSSAE